MTDGIAAALVRDARTAQEQDPGITLDWVSATLRWYPVTNQHVRKIVEAKARHLWAETPADREARQVEAPAG
jgi:hypothetical protein